jgi:energy-coupling factor transport system ATP-binding protein
MEVCFEKVNYIYAKGTPFEKRALNQLSLFIPSGQFIAIMGKNGSGKSTLAQIISGLLFATDGMLTVGSCQIKRKCRETAALRSMIGFVLQEPGQQLLGETVYEEGINPWLKRWSGSLYF